MQPATSIFDIEAPFQRYLPKSKILAILGSGRLRRESTLIFQFFLMKFGQMVRVTKKMTLTYKEANLKAGTEKRPFLRWGQNRKMGQKSQKKV